MKLSRSIPIFAAVVWSVVFISCFELRFLLSCLFLQVVAHATDTCLTPNTQHINILRCLSFFTAHTSLGQPLLQLKNNAFLNFEVETTLHKLKSVYSFVVFSKSSQQKTSFGTDLRCTSMFNTCTFCKLRPEVHYTMYAQPVCILLDVSRTPK